jgi:hypothetical protein
MSATFTDWAKVPASTERQIRRFWNSEGTATYSKGFDSNGDTVDVYKLESYKVADNLTYLDDAQKLKLFELAANHSFILSNLLSSLAFEIDTVRINNEIYHLPSSVYGTWPHCNLFGMMDCTGYIHT